jgi:beta-lactamase class D
MKHAAFFLLFTGFLSLSAPAMAMKGCTLIVEQGSGKTLYRDGDCDARYAPVSSFKLPLALMGYDAGILIDQHHPAWPYQEGYTLNKDDDRGMIDPATWESRSVVWYSQKLTAAMGIEKFRNYVTLFQYGNMDVSGDAGKDNALMRAWLMSSLQISPVEQVDFVRGVLNRKFPVTPQAYDMTIAIIPEFKAENGWTVKGKTGSGWLLDASGAQDKTKPQGWFVGWAEKGDRKIVFAKLVLTEDAKASPGGPIARDAFLVELPKRITD